MRGEKGERSRVTKLGWWTGGRNWVREIEECLGFYLGHATVHPFTS
jgi:hypothetical protein